MAPDFFPPILDPRVTLSKDVFVDFVGAPLPGNWSVFILYAIILSFNIFGEELWWRGYILPRQELSHGRFTWLIHGLIGSPFVSLSAPKFHSDPALLWKT